MRKVVAYELLSLDGVAEAPDEFITDWDDAMEENLAAVIADAGHRRPGPAQLRGVGRVLAGQRHRALRDVHQRCLEVRRHLDAARSDWARSTVVDGGLVEFVRDLKNRAGGDIGVHASISVAQALLAAGVVDELRLVIAPTIAGRGRRLFDGVPGSGSSRCRARPHPADLCSSTTALSGRRRSRAADPPRPAASLRAMRFPWDESRRAFADAASEFVRTAALVGDRWQEPGLGEWDVRALVGHTSRSLLTVEEYLARPATTVEVPSAPAYYAATSAMAAGPGVAARGVAAGQALGDDPATAVAGLAARWCRWSSAATARTS